MKLKLDAKGYGIGIFTGFEIKKDIKRKNPVLDKNGNEILNDDGEPKYPVGGDIEIEQATFKFIALSDYGKKVAMTIKQSINDKFFSKGEPTLKYYLYRVAGLPMPDEDNQSDDEFLKTMVSSAVESDDDELNILDLPDAGEDEAIEVMPQYYLDLEPFVNELKIKCKFASRSYQKNGKILSYPVIIPESIIKG